MFKIIIIEEPIKKEIYSRKEYDRIYREENREEINRKNREYRNINKDKIREKKRIYYYLNKDVIKEKRKKYKYDHYYKKYPEKRSFHDKKYRDSHSDNIKEYRKEYIKINKDKIKNYMKTYRKLNWENIIERKRFYYYNVVVKNRNLKLMEDISNGLLNSWKRYNKPSINHPWRQNFYKRKKDWIKEALK